MLNFRSFIEVFLCSADFQQLISLLYLDLSRHPLLVRQFWHPVFVRLLGLFSVLLDLFLSLMCLSGLLLPLPVDCALYLSQIQVMLFLFPLRGDDWLTFQTHLFASSFRPPIFVWFLFSLFCCLALWTVAIRGQWSLFLNLFYSNASYAWIHFSFLILR
jgi:hypothetical protein